MLLFDELFEEKSQNSSNWSVIKQTFTNFLSCLIFRNLGTKSLTCQTPTIALAIKMRRMTKGSTNAVMDSSSSSKKAKTKEIIAASNRILTRRSSNCSKTNCQMDLPSSAGNSEKVKKKSSKWKFHECFSNFFLEIKIGISQENLVKIKGDWHCVAKNVNKVSRIFFWKLKLEFSLKNLVKIQGDWHSVA